MSTNKINVIQTADGSSTIINEEINQTYHSVNGAVSESKYVFIENGLKRIDKKKVAVFEVGFGTGLNAALTCIEAIKNNIYVDYVTIEKYPLSVEIIDKLQFEEEIKSTNSIINNAKWDSFNKINDHFSIKKINEDFIRYKFDMKFDLIYFDAFSYDICPELWSEEIFQNIYQNLNENGILVTYSSKGIVKENLRKSGFDVKRIPGFKKHHMLIAKKLTDKCLKFK